MVGITRSKVIFGLPLAALDPSGGPDLRGGEEFQRHGPLNRSRGWSRVSSESDFWEI